MVKVTLNNKNFPETVVLRFENKEMKKKFLGQFLDGWGENCVYPEPINGSWDEMRVEFFEGDGREEEE